MTEKPLIIISSRTGNTLAVGHAVCDALPGAVMMRPSEVPDDLTPYNPVLLGFWCDRGDAPEEILRIAPRLRNKTIGCFATMGGDPEGEKSKAWMQKTSEKLVAMGEGNTLAETFLCRGRIDPEVFQRMTDMLGGTVSPEREAGRRLSETHPDRLDLDRAAQIFGGVVGGRWEQPPEDAIERDRRKSKGLCLNRTAFCAFCVRFAASRYHEDLSESKPRPSGNNRRQHG